MPKKYYSKNTVFYPLLIVSNIGLILSVTFVCQLIFTLISNTAFNLKFHKSQIFGSDQWDFSSNYSYTALLSSVFESIGLIIAYVALIEKANKIIDYALTNFLLQILIIWVMDGFPSLISFWIYNGVKVSLIILISEFASLKIESQDIKLNFNFLSGNL